MQSIRLVLWLTCWAGACGLGEGRGERSSSSTPESWSLTDRPAAGGGLLRTVIYTFIQSQLGHIYGLNHIICVESVKHLVWWRHVMSTHDSNSWTSAAQVGKVKHQYLVKERWAIVKTSICLLGLSDPSSHCNRLSTDATCWQNRSLPVNFQNDSSWWIFRAELL